MALLAVFAAIGIITATGAFTTVSADRTATVSVTGDASANLGLSSPDSLANSNYSQINNNDVLQLTLDSINFDARTTAIGVFQMQNNGEDTVNITLSKTDIDANSGSEESTPESDRVIFFVDDNSNNQYDSGEKLNGRNLDSGNTLVVSMYVDTSDEDLFSSRLVGGFDVDDGNDSGDNTNDLLDEITITVTSTAQTSES